MNTIRPASQSFRHRGFSYWVLGYHGFIEPIIREAVRMKLASSGYQPCKEHIVRKSDLDLAATCMRNNRTGLLLSDQEVDVFEKELRRRTRLQLDLAFERDDKLMIGEVKSWAGWGLFDQKMAKEAFFKNRDALLFLVHEIENRKVECVLIAVWGSQSDDHDAIRGLLEVRYGIHVEIEYADDLLANYPPLTVVEERIKLLQETSGDIERWLRSLIPNSNG